MNRRILLGLVLAVIAVLIGATGGRIAFIWFLLSVAIMVAAAFLLFDGLMHAGDEERPMDPQTLESKSIIVPGPSPDRNPETVQIDRIFSGRGGPLTDGALAVPHYWKIAEY
jgi:hypothetical protein